MGVDGPEPEKGGAQAILQGHQQSARLRSGGSDATIIDHEKQIPSSNRTA